MTPRANAYYRLFVTSLIVFLQAVCFKAFAGGWSVVTVQEAPEYMSVDVDRQVWFTVRAHGRTLIKTDMVVHAHHPASGDLLRFATTPMKTGHFLAELNFPRTGVWEWQINGYGEHPMPNINVTPTRSVADDKDLAMLGQRLFISKGCGVCHANQRVEHRGQLVAVGPDLSIYSADDAFLRAWLDNPTAVRSNAVMPDLDLNSADINALVAFINGK